MYDGPVGKDALVGELSSLAASLPAFVLKVSPAQALPNYHETVRARLRGRAPPLRLRGWG
jgi:hypothetical protein